MSDGGRFRRQERPGALPRVVTHVEDVAGVTTVETGAS